jgi:hypothetical protein
MKKLILFIDPYPVMKHSDNIPHFHINAHIGEIGDKCNVFVNDTKYAGNMVTDLLDGTIHIVPEFRQFTDPDEIVDYYSAYYDKCIEVAKLRVIDPEYKHKNIYFKYISPCTEFCNNLIGMRDELFRKIRTHVSVLAFEIHKREQVTLFDFIDN